jgi:hypothetical protein
MGTRVTGTVRTVPVTRRGSLGISFNAGYKRKKYIVFYVLITEFGILAEIRWNMAIFHKHRVIRSLMSLDINIVSVYD